MTATTDEPIRPLTHPGIILREELLAPMGMTDDQLADAIGVPQTEISAITQGKRPISADIGSRISRHFGMSEGFWTGLQHDYERDLASSRRRGAPSDSS